MTVTRFDGDELPEGWSAVEPAGGHVTVGGGYAALQSDAGANFDSIGSSISAPQGPRIQVEVAGAFDYAVALASPANTAASSGVSVLALDESAGYGVRFDQYVSGVDNRNPSWYGYRRDNTGNADLSLASTPSALWGPRAWMRISWDGVDSWKIQSSHTGLPESWHTHAEFTADFTPATFELALTAFGPDSNGREVRIGAVVDMDGRGDDATTHFLVGEIRDTIYNANLSGPELPEGLTATEANGGEAVVRNGTLRMLTDTAVNGSYAWVKGPDDLPADHGVLIRYRFPSPEMLTNSEFTSGADDWHAYDGATLTWEEGRGVAVYTPSASPPQTVQLGRPTATRPVVTPGKTYRATASVRLDVQRAVQLAFRWYDESGTEVSTSTSGFAQVGNQYMELSFQAVAPEGAATVSPRVWMLGAEGPSYVMRVDYFRLHEVNTVGVLNSFAAVSIRGSDDTDLPASEVRTDKYRPGTGLAAEVNGGSTSFGEIFRILPAYPTAVGVDFSGSREFYGFSMAVEDTESPVNGASGEWIWLRMEMVGPHYRARVWYDGDLEPETWHYEGEDYSVRGTGAAIAWSHNDDITPGGISVFEVSAFELYGITVEHTDPDAVEMFVLEEGIEIPVTAHVLESGVERPVSLIAHSSS